jgi:3-phenylpropionate/cinnamic acid dioxygenase small subunit
MASILEEKEELRDLVTRYCLYIDSGRYDDWVATFTEDGVFDSPILGRWQGKMSLKQFTEKYRTWTGNNQPRHCVMNVLVNVEGDHATGECYLLMTHASEGKTELVVSGRYEDRMEKVNGKWLFKERKVKPDNRPAHQ